ncbi:MAG: MBL fold metallo-hydrolase [Minisyncoccia bacterium]
MKIKKLGHSCLVININGAKIMLDPGKYSLSQVEERDIDIILITHEHSDHCHLESIKKILENNPQAEIITNFSVGKILEKESINYAMIEDGQKVVSHGVTIIGVGKLHIEAHRRIPVVPNTGFIINDKFFYPGDALHIPKHKVEVVAFPVGGGFLKISEVVEWLETLKPKVAIPVHDGLLNEDGKKTFYKNYQNILTGTGIEFKALEVNKEEEF